MAVRARCCVADRTFKLLKKSQSALWLMVNGNGARQLKTFDAVVEALGGARNVGEICDGQDTAAVCNWKRRRKRFPCKYYHVMKDELDAVGADASLDLWGFVKKKR